MIGGSHEKSQIERSGPHPGRGENRPAQHRGHRLPGGGLRHPDGILSGGRTRTLAFEESGRNLACLLFGEELEVPDDYVTRSEYVKSLKKSEV